MANTLPCMACAYGFTDTMEEQYDRIKGDATQPQIEHVIYEREVV